MSYLSLKNINKVYQGGVQAVFDFNLEVEKGEFIVLVGPSGCGKSTTLRMIAGLEAITTGEMLLNDSYINNLSPSERGIAMVFQDYALYGHMTVYQNIGFSLTIKGEKDDRIHERVMKVSQTVGLRPYLNRYPKALSGGQRQRVAMGRSLAKQAGVLLMDEPLSNLDAKLRQETRRELATLHHHLQATIIYVTHDQTEAMTLASRIVVMCDGHIQQIGTPYQIYHYPANIFTASFIGMPLINLISGYLQGEQFVATYKGLPILTLSLSPECLQYLESYRNEKLVMGLRPESLYSQAKELPSEQSLMVRVATVELLGADYNVGLDLKGFHLACKMSARKPISIGEEVEVYFDVNKVHFFSEKTGLRIPMIQEGVVR